MYGLGGPLMVALVSLCFPSDLVLKKHSHCAKTLQDLQRQTKLASPLLPEMSLDSFEMSGCHQSLIVTASDLHVG